MSREAMQMALEALESDPISHTGLVSRKQAITILRQELETKQEPVLWLKTWPDGSVSVLKTKSHAFADHELEPLYTAPPKKQWVGLTADEIWKCNKAKSGSAVEFHICSAHQNVLDFAESIEAKLKEKNHG